MRFVQRVRCAVWAAALFVPIPVMLAACSVPEKQAPAVDAGADGPELPGDGEAPETTIDEGPEMFSRSGQVTFRFSSDDPAATFMCRLDTAPAQVCQSPYVRALDDGTHSFSVRAVDSAGNSDDTPAERAWTIDTLAPDTSLTKGPPARDNSVMAQFLFRSNESNVAFDCSLDNAGFLPCTSGASFGPVGDGAHSFSVRARDRAGNVDPSPAVYAWSVDTSTPDTQLLDVPRLADRSTTATFTFISPDAGGGATFQCSIDGSAFAACTSPSVFPGLAEGAHRFSVRVRDAVGNVDPTPATHNWTVDLSPPNTTLAGGPVNTVPVASATFTFTANEPDAAFSCSLDGGPFTACTSPASFMTLPQGAHSFAVRATDVAGNTDASPATRSWAVDTVAPDVTITGGPGNGSTSGPRVVFTFTVSDGAMTCTLDGDAVAGCASPLAINLPAGAHQLSVPASDGAGNVTVVTRAWTVACGAPSVAGAAGLLHLDTADQAPANAVAGGAPATLGDTAAVEPADPAALAAGRFAGALAFTPTENDHVTWPIALPAMTDLTLELWAHPDAPAGARDVVVSGDGRLALRVIATSPDTVRFTISVVEGGMGGVTRSVSSVDVAAGVWHHVLASLQAPALRLWVDGRRTEVASVDLGAPLVLDTLRIGGTVTTSYDGALDEVWIAQTAITADEAALARYCPL
jgi:Concanavalin A-like lectin/glucanases superfamily